MEIAEGLKLHPGEDGTVPVQPRWVAATDLPEAVAVHDGVVYVAGSQLTAFKLRDGSILWEDDGEALEASGGVLIGLDGPDVVRVFAPYAYDLRVDRNTGHRIAFDTAQGTPPADFLPLPAEAPSEFRIDVDLESIDAYGPDARMVWRLEVDTPFVDPQPPIEADNAIILVTAGQHVVVLDRVSG